MKVATKNQPGIDELLLLSEQKSTTHSIGENGMQSIPISKTRIYHNHPFLLYEDERLADMASRIETNGILVPVIVR